MPSAGQPGAGGAVITREVAEGKKAVGEEIRWRVEWEREEQTGEGKRGRRGGTQNGKAIRVLRCDNLLLFSESESLLKFGNGKLSATPGSVLEGILGFFLQWSFFSFVIACPFFPEF